MLHAYTEDHLVEQPAIGSLAERGWQPSSCRNAIGAHNSQGVKTQFDFFSLSGCLLCDELYSNTPLSVRFGVCVGPRCNILLESDNFALLSDISPIVPGHCLLIPRQHFSSMAQLPPGVIEELQRFREACFLLVSRAYSIPLLFEHGSGPLEPKSGACIHHAHIHFLPLEAPVDLWMSEFGKVKELGRRAQYELPNRFSLIDYLAYQDQEGRCFLVSHFDKRLPCQFIRRRVAKHLGLPDWHWESVFVRKFPAEVTTEAIVGSDSCPKPCENAEVLKIA